MKLLAAVGALVMLVAAAAAAYFFGGFYPAGADSPHWGLTERVLEAVRDRSIARAAENEVSRPRNLEDASLALKGAAGYAEMCALCHSAPGASESLVRQGLYPKPPDFTRQSMEPARAFWVIKHGLKMSGMPAWGRTHDDAAIWGIVAFMQRLPKLSKAQYDEMVTKAPREEAMPGGHAHGAGPGMSPPHGSPATPPKH